MRFSLWNKDSELGPVALCTDQVPPSLASKAAWTNKMLLFKTVKHVGKESSEGLRTYSKLHDALQILPDEFNAGFWPCGDLKRAIDTLINIDITRTRSKSGFVNKAAL